MWFEALMRMEMKKAWLKKMRMKKTKMKDNYH
jgi:hypothetical protein